MEGYIRVCGTEKRDHPAIIHHILKLAWLQSSRAWNGLASELGSCQEPPRHEQNFISHLPGLDMTLGKTDIEWRFVRFR